MDVGGLNLTAMAAAVHRLAFPPAQTLVKAAGIRPFKGDPLEIPWRWGTNPKHHHPLDRHGNVSRDPLLIPMTF